MTSEQRNYSLLAVFIALASLAVTVVIGITSIKSSFNIAERSGAFEKPIFAPILGHHSLQPDEITEVVFGMDSSIPEGVPVIGFLPLGIRNNGERTLKNVTVTFRYSEVLQRDGLEALEFESVGIYTSKQVDRHFSKLGTAHYSSFRIPEIDPGATFQIADPLFLQETVFRGTVHVRKQIYSVAVSYAFQFEISISAENTKLHDYSVRCEVVHASNLTDLKSYISEQRAPQEAHTLRNNANFIEYLGLNLFRDTETTVILIYPVLMPVTADSITIYGPNSNKYEISAATYDIVQIKRLFN